MDSQRVTVIAPKTTTVTGFHTLPRLQQEINSITRNHNTKVLSHVEHIDILRVATDEEVPEIVHFAGHMTQDGFVGSKGIVPLSTIIMALQTAEPKLAIFNTCSSRDVAEQIASNCATDCIYTVGAVDDDRAFDFSVLFYSVLRSDDVDSYRHACNLVDPNDSVFHYISGKKKARRRMNSDELGRRITELNEAILKLQYSLNLEISLLKERNETHARWIETMEKQIAAMDRQIAAMDKHGTTTPTTITFSPVTFLTIGVITFVLTTVIIFFWR